jgi:hypothetical protein
LSSPARMSVGIVVEHRKLDHPWQSDRWNVIQLLPGRPAVAPWTLLAEGAGRQRYYAGALDLELYQGETEGYLDNLASSRPAVYVILRRAAGGGVVLHEATVDAGEIEAHADAGDDIIEALPIPPAVEAWMRDFVARHHVERPFYKRERDRPDPEALAVRRRVGGREPVDG